MNTLNPDSHPDVRNQHYVWRKYLSQWAVDGKIWCMRESHIFKQKPEKIAKEEYFYRISPLSEKEFKFIAVLLARMPVENRNVLDRITSFYLAASTGSDFERNNFLESYHAEIERKAGPILDEIISGNTSFWRDNDLRANFGAFIGLQYLRTKKNWDKLNNSLNPESLHPDKPDVVDLRKLTHYFAVLFAESIGSWIHSNSDLIVLRTQSDVEFLTSDQPAYNLMADIHKPMQAPEQFELYYPVSPTTAIIFNRKSSRFKRMTDDQYNEFVIQHSGQYVFSKTESNLQRYASHERK